MLGFILIMYLMSLLQKVGAQPLALKVTETYCPTFLTLKVPDKLISSMKTVTGGWIVKTAAGREICVHGDWWEAQFNLLGKGRLERITLHGHEVLVPTKFEIKVNEDHSIVQTNVNCANGIGTWNLFGRVDCTVVENVVQGHDNQAAMAAVPPAQPPPPPLQTLWSEIVGWGTDTLILIGIVLALILIIWKGVPCVVRLIVKRKKKNKQKRKIESVELGTEMTKIYTKPKSPSVSETKVHIMDTIYEELETLNFAKNEAPPPPPVSKLAKKAPPGLKELIQNVIAKKASSGETGSNESVYSLNPDTGAKEGKISK
ncbi:structural protein [Golden shiner toti-like virus 1]|nr:structural protein [Golden shiner toti-like virus 1]